MSYQEKYLKYKNKYLNFKKQIGGDHLKVGNIVRKSVNNNKINDKINKAFIKKGIIEYIEPDPKLPKLTLYYVSFPELNGQILALKRDELENILSIDEEADVIATYNYNANSDDIISEKLIDRALEIKKNINVYLIDDNFDSLKVGAVVQINSNPLDNLNIGVIKHIVTSGKNVQFLISCPYSQGDNAHTLVKVSQNDLTVLSSNDEMKYNEWARAYERDFNREGPYPERAGIGNHNGNYNGNFERGYRFKYKRPLYNRLLQKPKLQTGTVEYRRYAYGSDRGGTYMVKYDDPTITEHNAYGDFMGQEDDPTITEHNAYGDFMGQEDDS
jgi:hypothetical protein